MKTDRIIEDLQRLEKMQNAVAVARDAMNVIGMSGMAGNGEAGRELEKVYNTLADIIRKYDPEISSLRANVQTRIYRLEVN